MNETSIKDKVLKLGSTLAMEDWRLFVKGLSAPLRRAFFEDNETVTQFLQDAIEVEWLETIAERPALDRLLGELLRFVNDRHAAGGAALQGLTLAEMTPSRLLSHPSALPLCNLLCQAYDSEDSMSMRAKMAGVNLGTWKRNGKVLDGWQALLEEAAKQGKLHTLIEQALQDPLIRAYEPEIRRLAGARGIDA